jgi:hypothetical protein
LNTSALKSGPPPRRKREGPRLRVTAALGGAVVGGLLNIAALSLATELLRLIPNAHRDLPDVGGWSGVAVYQFAYLWPLWRLAARRGRPSFAVGLKFAAGLTALVVGLCWSFVMPAVL